MEVMQQKDLTGLRFRLRFPRKAVSEPHVHWEVDGGEATLDKGTAGAGSSVLEGARCGQAL